MKSTFYAHHDFLDAMVIAGARLMHKFKHVKLHFLNIYKQKSTFSIHMKNLKYYSNFVFTWCSKNISLYKSNLDLVQKLKSII